MIRAGFIAVAALLVSLAGAGATTISGGPVIDPHNAAFSRIIIGNSDIGLGESQDSRMLGAIATDHGEASTDLANGGAVVSRLSVANLPGIGLYHVLVEAGLSYSFALVGSPSVTPVPVTISGKVEFPSFFFDHRYAFPGYAALVVTDGNGYRVPFMAPIDDVDPLDQSYSLNIEVVPNTYYSLGLTTYIAFSGFINYSGYSFDDYVDLGRGFHAVNADLYIGIDPSIDVDPAFAGSFAVKTSLPGGGLLSGAVPEPATWATMLCGFAMVGSALRRRVGVPVQLRRG